MKIFTFEAEATTRVMVTVRARDEAEARLKLENGDFEDADVIDGPLRISSPATADVLSSYEE